MVTVFKKTIVIKVDEANLVSLERGHCNSPAYVKTDKTENNFKVSVFDYLSIF